MDPRVVEMIESILANGWTVFDPYVATQIELNHVNVTDAGWTCNVCGQASPQLPKELKLPAEWMPSGASFRDPTNHDVDCVLMILAKELPEDSVWRIK